MKVFLSHSTKDKAFVEKLAKELEANGMESWLCEVDVLIGDDFVEEIERGLKETDLTLLIWSPSAASSAWTGKEWRSVLARETEESRKRLGIILLHDAELPQLLRTKNYVDARTDQPTAIKETVDWLVRQQDMRRYEKEGAARFIVDYEPTDFVGRADYFEKLHDALVEEKGKYLLWGGPGSGKSTLALKFAWKAQGAFDSVVFQHCGQRSVEEIGIELAERIGLGVKEQQPDRQIEEVKKWVCERRTLLVLDDVWNLDVKDLIPSPPFSVSALSVLCTSRVRSWSWVKQPRRLEVKSFLDEETEALFRMWLEEEIVTRHRDDLLAFAERVERLPIAVAVAAEMLSRQFGPLDEATTAIELKRLRNEVHDIPGLLQQAIESQSEQNQRLLRSMAVCHPEGFWFPLVSKTSGIDDTESNQARDQLINASLVQVVDQGRQRFRIHALLREQLLQSITIAELRERHVQALEKLFAEWEKLWRDCRECLTEVIPALKICYAQNSLDRIAWLSYNGYATGRRVGELQMALQILQQEEQFWKGKETNEAKEVLQRSYGNQALILQAWGQLEEAMALHKKQEALCVELGLRSSLGYCYWNWGLLARELNEPDTEQEKLKAALQIFTDLKMPKERDAVQKELENMK